MKKRMEDLLLNRRKPLVSVVKILRKSGVFIPYHKLAVQRSQKIPKKSFNPNVLVWPDDY